VVVSVSVCPCVRVCTCVCVFDTLVYSSSMRMSLELKFHHNTNRAVDTWQRREDRNDSFADTLCLSPYTGQCWPTGKAGVDEIRVLTQELCNWLACLCEQQKVLEGPAIHHKGVLKRVTGRSAQDGPSGTAIGIPAKATPDFPGELVHRLSDDLCPIYDHDVEGFISKGKRSSRRENRILGDQRCSES
jgi:hypothetical protein